ncbi:hypothetical protein BS47DRAFT_1310112, partial [Hydnum rufescens UP504]
MSEKAICHTVTTVSKEMDALKHRFAMCMKDVSVDYLSGFSLHVCCEYVKLEAPVLWRLLNACAQTDRAADENKIKNPAMVCTIVAMQLAKERSNHANHLAVAFSLFLYANGAPRRIIEVLSKMGLCTSYISIMESV